MKIGLYTTDEGLPVDGSTEAPSLIRQSWPVPFLPVRG
jgi:hypothetical protein